MKNPEKQHCESFRYPTLLKIEKAPKTKEIPGPTTPVQAPLNRTLKLRG